MYEISNGLYSPRPEKEKRKKKKDIDKMNDEKGFRKKDGDL